jgi:hypothetical protein
MGKKRKITLVVMVAIGWLFLLGLISESAADVTASARTSKDKYLEGEAIPAWITLHVSQDVTVDGDILKLWKFERMLDVRSPKKDKLIHKHYKTNPGELEPKPRSPHALKTVLPAGDYDVVLADLNEHYDIIDLGVYTLRLVASLATFDAGGSPTTEIISSKIDKFEVYKESSVAFDFTPDTLSLKSKGKAVTGYLSAFPAGYSAADVIIGSVKLRYDGQSVPAYKGEISGGVLMVKFDRAAVQAMLSPAEEIELLVTGNFDEWETFTGSDTIICIEGGGK